MSTFVGGNEIPEPVDVRVTRETFSVGLADGRTISAPTQWYPRLFHGTPEEWENFELNYDGIHWPDLNEDISVEALLRGEKSGESLNSIRRWLRYRARGQKEPITELSLPPEIARELNAIGLLSAKKGKVSTAKRHKKAS